nr:hypothetical protein [Propionibacterium sp.]
MTALHPDQVASVPVRPHRADRGANARPRSTAPAAAGPRARTWTHVPRSSVNVEVATALALQAPPVRRAPVGERPPATVTRLLEDTVPVRRLAAEPRYEWTPRGLAVLLALVAIVVGIMTITLVSAFLAVSSEPLTVAAPAPAAVALQTGPGQGR